MLYIITKSHDGVQNEKININGKEYNDDLSDCKLFWRPNTNTISVTKQFLLTFLVNLDAGVYMYDSKTKEVFVCSRIYTNDINRGLGFRWG